MRIAPPPFDTCRVFVADLIFELETKTRIPLFEGVNSVYTSDDIRCTYAGVKTQFVPILRINEEKHILGREQLLSAVVRTEISSVVYRVVGHQVDTEGIIVAEFLCPLDRSSWCIYLLLVVVDDGCESVEFVKRVAVCRAIRILPRNSQHVVFGQVKVVVGPD